MAHRRPRLMASVLIAALTLLSVPCFVYAASCDAIVGQWMWFIGGEVTIKSDGTFTQQSGNVGTWECNDGAQGRFTFRWRDGGFTNSLLLSPDGQGLTSTDTSQWYVTARRTGSAPSPQPPPVRKQDPAPSPQPPLVREENCCQEAYACEVKKIEAEFERKSAECRGQGGNALCFKAAVSTKASGLQAAGEKLRLCNRADNPGVMPPGRTTGNQAPSGGLSTRDLPPPPSSSDEFHSTEQTGDPCQCMAWPDQVAGDVFASDSPGANQGQPPSSGDVFGSDSSGSNTGKPTPQVCTPDYHDRDVPAAGNDWRYVMGFEQEVRRCLKAQVTAENLALYALARKVKEVGVALAVVAAPGAIDAVLHPPGISPNPNPYLQGKEEAARLCEWGLKISPLVMARCPSKGLVRTVPKPQMPPRQSLAQLLSDLSWLKLINPTGSKKNCGKTVVATDNVLAGGEVMPTEPTSCGTFPGQLESLYGAEFSPIKPAADINNMIFLAGEGARGIVSAEGPGGGHYFNIVRFGGEVLLLDGQLGRLVSWAQYAKMGLRNFQLLRTN